MNAKRKQLYDSDLVKLFNELFSDVLERQILTDSPSMEDEELTLSETSTFLSFFNSRKVDSDTDVQHPHLLPEFGPYQEDAVLFDGMAPA